VNRLEASRLAVVTSAQPSLFFLPVGPPCHHPCCPPCWLSGYYRHYRNGTFLHYHRKDPLDLLPLLLCVLACLVAFQTEAEQSSVSRCLAAALTPRSGFDSAWSVAHPGPGAKAQMARDDLNELHVQGPLYIRLSARLGRSRACARCDHCDGPAMAHRFTRVRRRNRSASVWSVSPSPTLPDICPDCAL